MVVVVCVGGAGGQDHRAKCAKNNSKKEGRVLERASQEHRIVDGAGLTSVISATRKLSSGALGQKVQGSQHHFLRQWSVT